MRTRPNSQDTSAPLNLSSALSESSEQKAFEPKKITLTMTTPTDIKISFEGFWDGHLIRIATNKIERQYRTIRHQKLRDVTTAHRAEIGVKND